MTENIGFRWFVVALVMGLALAAWFKNDLNQGIDLKGGHTLSYSIDPRSLDEARGSGSAEKALDETVKVISTRINNLGVKDLSVRREGTSRLVIQAPDLKEQELEDIKSRMLQLGKLGFPIGLGSMRGEGASSRTALKYILDGQPVSFSFDETVADQQRQAAIERDKPLIEEARRTGKALDPLWVRPGLPYRYIHNDIETTIEWIPWTPGAMAKREKVPGEEEAREALRKAQLGEDFNSDYVDGGWVYYDPDYYGGGKKGFDGSAISRVQRSQDRLGGKAVSYDINSLRQGEFEEYTQRHVNTPMCIVLNDEIWTNPNITTALRDNVQITRGGGFTEAEQLFMINGLQAGSLQLRPVFEGSVQVNPTLGKQAISRGVLATILGGALVVLFMLFYYRFSGVVAIIALVANLALILAVLALFQATLTLPGIAGIVLTIGMSVDANILIFERIREELRKGKTLVAAAQSGFDRAFVTIIDANLTTVITAIILYKFGVGPIKGFAVTLMAGIACSLFAAVYLSRTLFATAIKFGWVKDDLKMSSLLKPGSSFNFMGMSKTWVRVSALLILVALGIFFGTGTNKYGLDFTGGTIARVNLLSELEPDAVASRMAALESEGTQRYTAVEVTRLSDTTEVDGNTLYSYDVHLQSTREVPIEQITEISHTALKEALVGLIDTVESPVERTADSGLWDVKFTTTAEFSADELATLVNEYRLGGDEGRAPLRTAWVNAENPIVEDRDGRKLKVSKEFTLEFSERDLVGYEAVKDDIVQTFSAELPKSADGAVDYNSSFGKLDFMGPNVVADLKQQAIIAVVLSLIALILYIWFRFKELKYGLAASGALFHDVIVALGVVVGLNYLGVVHVPLNLPIIAGFLTLIGYSLNDTIVLFDRVRENLGNVKGSFRDVINLSINQTLSRTILTSITTFLVVLVLFALNYGSDSPLEGIAFTLMVGVVVGTYSSIFIASPLVIWMHNREVEAKKNAS